MPHLPSLNGLPVASLPKKTWQLPWLTYSRARAKVMLDAEAWVATAFLMFIGVLAYLGVYRKVAAALDRRQALIKTKLDEARLLREEAQAVLVAYQSKQREGMREAEAIISSAKI